jgi:hypothetical protein
VVDREAAAGHTLDTSGYVRTVIRGECAPGFAPATLAAMRLTALLGAALLLVLPACGGSGNAAPPPSELTGVITDVREESGTVSEFTLDSIDGIYEIRIADDVDYGFDLRHLYEHEQTREPVRCELEQRADGETYALQIDDA